MRRSKITKRRPRPQPAKVLSMPKPSGPSPEHPFFSFWHPELEYFCLSTDEVSDLKIKPGDILYCEEIAPQPGDIVITPIAVAGRIYVDRCIQYDGFRILTDGIGGLCYIRSALHVLVVKHIAPE